MGGGGQHPDLHGEHLLPSPVSGSSSLISVLRRQVKVEKALEEERGRVAAYLNAETENKLLQVLDKELLENKEQVSLPCRLLALLQPHVAGTQELLAKEGSGLKVLLMNDMLSDLSRMFRLFSRVQAPVCPSSLTSTCSNAGLIPVAEIVKQHIIDLGTEKINQRLSRVSSAGSSAEKESNDDPQFIKVRCC